VDFLVDKWEEFNLLLIKLQQFNGLHFSVLTDFQMPIAPKKGIDNFPANL
jgi:hypothetical protein